MKKVDLTTGNVFRVLSALAIPIMGSSLLQFAYGLVDMLWVGELGSDAITVVGSTSFFVGLGYSINAIVVIGAGIKISHSIGEKNDVKTKEYINSGLALNLFIGLLYMAILIFFGKYLINFLNLSNYSIINNSYKYLVICGPMLFLSFFNSFYVRILNSFGNNKIVLKINTIGIIINIILDPILIYVFKMGVLGAAVATLISNFVIFVMFNIEAKSLIKFDKSLGVNMQKVNEILKLGFPMASQRILFTVVNIVLAKIIAIFGDDAIAAQKIGLQVESVTYMVIGGLNGAISSFIGQNFGAKKYDRVKKGYITALKIGLIYAGITTITFIFTPFLVSIFVKDAKTILMASDYLIIIGFSQIFNMIEMVSNGMFTGIGKPKIPSIISIIFTLLRIPFALILIKIFGLNGIWIAIALSSILKGIIGFVVYKFSIGKKLSIQVI